MSTKGLGDEVIVQIQQVLPETNSVPGTVSASRGTGTSDGALGRTGSTRLEEQYRHYPESNQSLADSVRW